MILDVPIPGLDGWDEAVSDPSAWHVRFMQVPELPEKLVDGRQADYFQYFRLPPRCELVGSRMSRVG